MNKEYIRQIIRNNINEIIDENSCVFCGDITNEDLRKWFGKGKQGGAGGRGWDRYASDGQKLGKCGDGKEGGAYAVCLSKEKARKLGPKGRASFVRRKRANQKKAGDSKKGRQRTKGKKPVYTKTRASESYVPVIEGIKIFSNGQVYESHWTEVPTSQIVEAEYQGRKVKLNQPMRGGNKKFFVYVKDPKTKNIKKVSFGDTTGLSIKRDDPEKRKSFRARHKCDQAKDKTKARYWSCQMWRSDKSVADMLK